eukprot:TRINITY_DN42464_c0_g1_i1.p1 TRINITY_DN42464_c0_g1~~TRINITY_DN42464_c0_g1_i1.p1  ORF type:complete len:153 (-),score=3.77 TRINITY_DN42464_c0_g1_i1:199-657(-)
MADNLIIDPDTLIPSCWEDGGSTTPPPTIRALLSKVEEDPPRTRRGGLGGTRIGGWLEEAKRVFSAPVEAARLRGTADGESTSSFASLLLMWLVLRREVTRGGGAEVGVVAEGRGPLFLLTLTSGSRERSLGDAGGWGCETELEASARIDAA